jgi:hypothetical protein
MSHLIRFSIYTYTSYPFLQLITVAAGGFQTELTVEPLPGGDVRLKAVLFGEYQRLREIPRLCREIVNGAFSATASPLWI